MGLRCAIRTKVTLPDKRFCVAIIGSVHELGRWDRLRPVLGIYQGNGVWQVRVKLPTDVDIEYKWILYEQRGCTIVDYEPGENRRLRVVDVPLMVDDYLNGVQEIRVMENDEMTDLHHCSAMATAQFGKGTNKWMANFTAPVEERAVSEIRDDDNAHREHEIPHAENSGGQIINSGSTEPVNANIPEVPERDTNCRASEISNPEQRGGQRRRRSENTDPFSAGVPESENGNRSRRKSNLERQRVQIDSNNAAYGTDVDQKRRQFDRIENVKSNGFSKNTGSGHSTNTETDVVTDSDRTVEMEDVLERSMRVEDLKVEVLASKLCLQRLLGRVREVNPIVKLITSDVFKRIVWNMLKIGGTTAVAFIAVILYRIYSEDDDIDPDMFL